MTTAYAILDKKGRIITQNGLMAIYTNKKRIAWAVCSDTLTIRKVKITIEPLKKKAKKKKSPKVYYPSREHEQDSPL